MASTRALAFSLPFSSRPKASLPSGRLLPAASVRPPRPAAVRVSAQAFSSRLIASRRRHAACRAVVRTRCASVEEIQAQKSAVEADTKAKMEKTIEAVQVSFNSVRTGRATPAMLDRTKVEYYGSLVPLKSIAQITAPDSATLVIQPYDKSSLKIIEKAIVQTAELGMTPNNDGAVLRMTVPQPTADRRKELLKQVAKHTEEGKVAVRNIRRDAIKAYEKLKKEKKLSEDNLKEFTEDIQKLTDEYIKKIDALEKLKEKDLMTV